MIIIIMMITMTIFAIPVGVNIVEETKAIHLKIKAKKLRLEAEGYEGYRKGELLSKATAFEDKAAVWRNA